MGGVALADRLTDQEGGVALTDRLPDQEGGVRLADQGGSTQDLSEGVVELALLRTGCRTGTRRPVACERMRGGVASWRPRKICSNHRSRKLFPTF